MMINGGSIVAFITAACKLQSTLKKQQLVPNLSMVWKAMSCDETWKYKSCSNKYTNLLEYLKILSKWPYIITSFIYQTLCFNQ